MSRKKLTPEEARALGESKRKKADDLIAAAIEELTDPEAWAAFLTRAASLGKYSMRNQLLIGMQCPEATDISGYVEWQDRGRQVRKGEAGILIFAPFTRKEPAENGQPADREPQPGDETVRRMRGIKVTSVFDISQTDPIEGKPFRPRASAPARGLDEIREAIESIAGDHAEAILAALDGAEELVSA